MPYIVTYTVKLENGEQETRELVYFPKPDNGNITHEQAARLAEENRADYFIDCLTVTYMSYYYIPEPMAGL